MIKKSVLMGMILLAFISCQTEEICYSCNESVNDWVLNNMESISAMNREDIIKLSSEKQRAVFRALTPLKRKSVWKDKLLHLKNNINTNQEQKLIAYVENIVDKLSFKDELTDEEYYEIEAELLPLVQAANWSKSKMVYAFGSLQNSKNASDDFNVQNMAQEEEPDCDCRWGWCGLIQECQPTDCEETNLGCGMLGLGSCTEKCGEPD